MGSRRLSNLFEAIWWIKKRDCIITREPGGTKVAEQIRKMILNPEVEDKMLPETELLLLFAGRVQHVAHVIRPALAKGAWVICDRFLDASYAYQGAGRGIDITYIQMLEKWLVSDLVPNLTILLDMAPEIGLARAKHRGPHDRIEAEHLDFHQRVRLGYLQRAKDDPSRFRILDASQPLVVVQAELKALLDEIY